jgi:hypothetical protein
VFGAPTPFLIDNLKKHLFTFAHFPHGDPPENGLSLILAVAGAWLTQKAAGGVFIDGRRIR